MAITVGPHESRIDTNRAHIYPNLQSRGDEQNKNKTKEIVYTL